MANRTFFQQLPILDCPLRDLLANEGAFVTVPDDWWIIVVDIEGSTQAVAAGRHHEVNFAATGSIIAVLNQLKRHEKGLEIPYFFGGDGATFLVPAGLHESLVTLLHRFRLHVEKQMKLNLRVGSLRVDQVVSDSCLLRISRIRLNALYTIPVVLGNGLKKAEDRIKASFIAEADDNPDPAPVDLEGMECRWAEIPPPRDRERIVCLLVSCPDDSRQGPVYARVIGKLDTIFGELDNRRPVSVSRLRLNLGLTNLAREMYASLGRFSLRYLVRNWLATLYGPYYFRNTEAGKRYLNKITSLTDTLMIDGNLNTVVSGTPAQIREMTDFLSLEEAAGRLVYGLHATHASVMSCYVLDHDEDHIHFVDGTEGGYTSAARMFKNKRL